MQKTGLLLGFAPLVVYGILSGTTHRSVTIALAAALITTLLVGYRDLRKGMILPLSNLFLFAAALLAVGVLGTDWIIPYLGILIYAALAAVALGSILAGTPFTLQYAREMVEPKVRDHPLFYRVNLLMTTAWCLVFTMNLILSMAILVFSPSQGRILQYLTYIVLLAGIAFTLWFPERMRRMLASPRQAPDRVS